MCLAIPAKIAEIQGETARVSLGGNSIVINIALTPNVAVGDFVLVHAGFALQRIKPGEAATTLKLLEELHGTVAE